MKIKLSDLFYALSDPIRIKIMKTLIQEGEISCGACKASVSKSTMSHHFKVLREAGMIRKKTIGKLHFISLRKADIERRLPGILKSISFAKSPY
jgi:DNA-binding transcriptional ArsR family regulator